ncbi:MAG TPA: hypothetical protein VEL11_06525 [Candidatus Bathyarchaeia archaeon]|nr:hypothetical protein [Candidatus Bathyarchaeia archaeon]
MTREYITNKQIPEELIMRLIENAHALCTTAQRLLSKGTYVFFITGTILRGMIP